MYQNTYLNVTPELFSQAKDKALGIIAWAGIESGQTTSREFNELLAGYLTTAHFAFIEREARLHHSVSEMKGSLNPRQNEILHFILMGLTNKGISETLMVSEATVHHEVTRIFKAFHVSTRGLLIDYFRKTEEAARAQALADAPPPPSHKI